MTDIGGRLPELFVFYKDGAPFHYHQDRKVFENWMANSAWLYPRDRCEIVRYVPEACAGSSPLTSNKGNTE